MFGQFAAGFMQGFGESFAEDYRTREANYQKYVDLGIENAKRNAPRVQQQKARMAQFEKTQKELEDKFGIDKNTFLLMASKGDVNNIVSRINNINEKHVGQYGTDIDLTGLRKAFDIAGEVDLPEGMTYEQAVDSILGANLSALQASGNPKSEAAKTQAGAKSFMSFLMRNPRMSAEEAMQQMQYAGYSVSDLANYTEGFSTDVFEGTSIDTTGTGVRFDYDPERDQARRVSTTTTALYNKLQNVAGVDETATSTDLTSILNVDQKTAAEIKLSYADAASKISILERKLVMQGQYGINAVMRQDLVNDLIENLDSEDELATLKSSISKQETVDFILERITSKGGLTQEDMDAIITDTVGKKDEGGSEPSGTTPSLAGADGAPAVAEQEAEAAKPKAEAPSIITENAELSDVHSNLNDANKKKLEEAAQTGVNPIALQKTAEAMLTAQGGKVAETPTDETSVSDEVAAAPETTILPKITEARDNKDGDVANYEAVYDTIMSLPEEQRSEYVSIFSDMEDDADIMDVVEKAGGIVSAAGEWIKKDLDKSAGNITGVALQGAAIASEGLNKVANFFNVTPEGQSALKIMEARELRELGKRLFAEGFTEVYAGSEAAAKRKEITDSIAASRTAERIAQALFKTEDARIEDLKRTRGTDRIPLGNPNLPITPREAGESPTADQKVEAITYEQWDAMSAAERRKLGLPTSRVGVQQIVKNGTIELPEGVTRAFLLEEGFDIAPALEGGDTASQVAAMAETGGDRSPNNAGLMSRPAQPPRLRTEERPDMGAADIMPMVTRLHGEGSAASKRFSEKVSAGTVKAVDVTRLIKQTQSLPKTKSRDKLLAELYTMRDELNNR